VWDDVPVIVEQHLIDLLRRKIVQAGKYYHEFFFAKFQSNFFQ
jgi:hypothetical protein